MACLYVYTNIFWLKLDLKSMNTLKLFDITNELYLTFFQFSINHSIELKSFHHLPASTEGTSFTTFIQFTPPRSLEILHFRTSMEGHKRVHTPHCFR